MEENDVVSVLDVGGGDDPPQRGEDRIGRTVRSVRRVRDPVQLLVREAVDLGGLGLVGIGIAPAEHQPWEELGVR